MKRILVVLVALMSLSACMIGDTEHRIFINADGSAEWVVLERNLRSNSGDADERLREEQAFLDAIRLGAHPVETAFRRLGAEWVDLKVLRGRRPFSVWTAARFSSLEELGSELAFQLGIHAEVAVSSAGGRTRLDVVIDPEGSEGEVMDEAVLALVDELSSYRIVLSDGRFIEAVGFDLDEDGASASPVAPDEGENGNLEEPILLSLVWSAELSS